jgi:hypothetical protein
MEATNQLAKVYQGKPTPRRIYARRFFSEEQNMMHQTALSISCRSEVTLLLTA